LLRWRDVAETPTVREAGMVAATLGQASPR
jgi:hypothetical protein